MAIGSAIGIVLGRNQILDRVFDPWVILLLNIPALVIIVLSYIWFGLNEVAAIGAVALNKIPNVVVTIREGARSLELQYAEMAKVFRFSRWQMLKHVVLPQLQPFFAAARAIKWCRLSNSLVLSIIRCRDHSCLYFVLCCHHAIGRVSDTTAA